MPPGSRADDENLPKYHGTLLGDERNRIVDGLDQLARQLDWTLGQLPLAWVLKNSRISSAILGAARPGQR